MPSTTDIIQQIKDAQKWVPQSYFASGLGGADLSAAALSATGGMDFTETWMGGGPSSSGGGPSGPPIGSIQIATGASSLSGWSSDGNLYYSAGAIYMDGSPTFLTYTGADYVAIYFDISASIFVYLSAITLSNSGVQSIVIVAANNGVNLDAQYCPYLHTIDGETFTGINCDNCTSLSFFGPYGSLISNIVATNCTSLTSCNISASALPNIQDINMSGSYNLSYIGGGNYAGSNLFTLRLSGSGVGDYITADNCSSLAYIDISYTQVPWLSATNCNSSFDVVLTGAGLCHTVDISGNTGTTSVSNPDSVETLTATNHASLNISGAFGSLQTIDISGSVFNGIPSMANLAYLTTANFSGTTGYGLSLVMSDCPNLAYVDLSGAYIAGAVDLLGSGVYATELVVSCNGLVADAYLRLYGCTTFAGPLNADIITPTVVLGDSGVTSIQLYGEVAEFYCQNCPSLTDLDLAGLGVGTLNILDASGCGALISIAHNGVNTSGDISDCPSLTTVPNPTPLANPFSSTLVFADMSNCPLLGAGDTDSFWTDIFDAVVFNGAAPYNGFATTAGTAIPNPFVLTLIPLCQAPPYNWACTY